MYSNFILVCDALFQLLTCQRATLPCFEKQFFQGRSKTIKVLLHPPKLNLFEEQTKWLLAAWFVPLNEERNFDVALSLKDRKSTKRATEQFQNIFEAYHEKQKAIELAAISFSWY